jgi:uncharacterized protein YraI
VKRHIYKALAVGALLAFPSLASAATQGFATANVNMRSGPSTRYPAVVVIPVGAPISINGCLDTVNWCDVSFARGRGWVSGNYIQTTYRQNRVYVDRQYYRPLGIPTITFDVDTYWRRYYSDRDFYRDRGRWRGWDYRRDAPPPPPPRYDSRRDDPIRDPNRYREDGRYRYEDRNGMNGRDRYDGGNRPEDRNRPDDRNRFDGRPGPDGRDGNRNWDGERRDRGDGWRPDDNRRPDDSRRQDQARPVPDGDQNRDRQRGPQGSWVPSDRCTQDNPCPVPGQ